MKQLVVILASFLIASGLQVINTIIIERSMGIEAVGQYGVFLSTIMMLAVVFQFGLRDFATLHYVNNSSSSKNISALLRAAVFVCTSMCVILAAFQKQGDLSLGAFQFLLENFLSISLSVLVLVLSNFLSGVAIANRDFLSLGYFRDYGRHLATFFLIMLFFLVPSLKEYFYLGWGLIFLFLSLTFSYRYSSVLKEAFMGPGRFVAAFKKSVAFYVNDLILNVIALGDVILLAFFLGAEDLGIYFICSRIAVLMNVFLTLVSSHNSPALAKLIVNGEHSVSIEIMSLTSKMLSFISVPLVFLVIVFSADLLLFWDVDERYGLVLEILFLGRFFNVLTGNVGKYLIYSEKRRIEVLNNTISFTLMILLIAGLVPWYGIIGAAVANSLGLIVLNIVKYVEFKTFFSSGYIGITQIYYTVLLAFSYCLFKLVGDSLNPVVLSLVFLVFYLGLTVSIAKRDIINYLNLINAHKKTVLVE